MGSLLSANIGFHNFGTDVDVLLTALIRVAVATFIGGFLGMERGKQGRAAGMRTHILVCVGATLTSMTGMYANTILGVSSDPLRIAAQVISGIGFLGVGTIIIKGRFQITGLTTAAGLWAAASVGIALGIGFYEGALIAFAICALSVSVMQRFEYRVTKADTRFGMYIEIRSDTCVRKTVDFLEENYRTSDIQITPPRSGIQGNVGIEVNIHEQGKTKYHSSVVAKELETLEEVVFAIESI